jgi:nicotinamidase-related amidase
MPLETTRRGLLIGILGVARLFANAKTSTRTIRLPLRTRVEAFKGSGLWQEAHFEKELPVAETALLICDMWDNHWCSGAANRVNALVKVMAPVVDQARAGGIQIIHAPSDVMAFYKDYPQRQRVLALPQVSPPAALDLSDPPLPIDDAKGGCDTRADKFYKAWRRQHAGIRITGDDAISDQGSEIYSLLKKEGIGNLLVMGVHTNMCVLKRTFAIRQMTNWGVRCVLVRDLTDSMYDPQTSPYVAHEQGTELVVQHIEKHWCPSVLSSELTRALRA